MWSRHHIETIRQYILAHADHLKSKFYENIIAGAMKYRKAKGFFKNLGRLLGRSSIKCKSKFQKMEPEIYMNFLKVPKRHFDCYEYIRKGFKLTSKTFLECGDASPKTNSESEPNSSSPKRKVFSLDKAFEAQRVRPLQNHIGFENLRIEIILKFKAGELKFVKIGKFEGAKIIGRKQIGACSAGWQHRAAKSAEEVPFFRKSQRKFFALALQAQERRKIPAQQVWVPED